MADHRAIAAVGQAILQLLESACPRHEESTTKLEYKLYQSRDFQTPPGEGIALYLYRVAPSANRRHLPPRRRSDGRCLRAPLLIDLFYLLTIWSSDAKIQHRRLGWCLRTLDNTPILPASLLNSFGPEPDIFRPDETVEIVGDMISTAEQFQIYDPMKPHVPLGAAYVVRMLAIDSELVIDAHPPVQTRVFDLGSPVVS